MTDKFYYPATIIKRDTPPDELTGLLPDDLDQAIKAFFFSAEISSNRLDSHFSRMDKSSLINFANDSSAGVSFLDSHVSRMLGYGQSLKGVYLIEGDVQRVVTDFYTVHGVKFGGNHSYATSDDFILATQSGIMRDVSVGFHNSRDVCDICGENVWGFTDCRHWPGTVYPVGEQGSETVLATYTIYDARLAEVSAVFDGATPGAMIIKAQHELRAGRLSHDQARALEVRYRAKFPILDQSWQGIEVGANVTDKNQRSNNPMLKDGHKPDDNSLEQQIRQLLPEDQREGDLVEKIGWYTREVGRLNQELTKANQSLTTANERVAELEPQAADGRKYRQNLIEQALTQGVRANGETFSIETYRQTLKDSDIGLIQRMHDDWKAVGDRQFTAGRKVDDEETPHDQVSNVPDFAYMS